MLFSKFGNYPSTKEYGDDKVQYQVLLKYFQKLRSYMKLKNKQTSVYVYEIGEDIWAVYKSGLEKSIARNTFCK